MQEGGQKQALAGNCLGRRKGQRMRTCHQAPPRSWPGDALRECKCEGEHWSGPHSLEPCKPPREVAAQANPGQVAGKLAAVGSVRQLTLGRVGSHAPDKKRPGLPGRELASLPAGYEGASVGFRVWLHDSTWQSRASGMVKVGRLWNVGFMPGF